MKSPVSKEEITLWLESELLAKIRQRAEDLDVQLESLIEDALFEVFDSRGLARVYSLRVPPSIKFRVREDTANYKRSAPHFYARPDLHGQSTNSQQSINHQQSSKNDPTDTPEP